MKASARIEVARRDGRDVLVDVRSEPPLAVRATPERVLLVGSAAAPVGGDELALDVVVGPGARLALGTVAATLAWPGPHGDQSTHRVHASVGPGGHLSWEPEPLVPVAGCRHASTTTVDLGAGATAWIVEEVVLGRTGEPAGSLTMSWRIERDGRPLVHHAERLGPDVPGWGGAVTTAGHRHLLAVVAVGPSCPVGAPIVTTHLAVAILPMSDDVWVLLATGSSRAAVRAALSSGREGDLVERQVVGAVGERVFDTGRDGHRIGDTERPRHTVDDKGRATRLDEPQHQLGVVVTRTQG